MTQWAVIDNVCGVCDQAALEVTRDWSGIDELPNRIHHPVVALIRCTNCGYMTWVQPARPA